MGELRSILKKPTVTDSPRAVSDSDGERSAGSDSNRPVNTSVVTPKKTVRIDSPREEQITPESISTDASDEHVVVPEKKLKRPEIKAAEDVAEAFIYEYDFGADGVTKETMAALFYGAYEKVVASLDKSYEANPAKKPPEENITEYAEGLIASRLSNTRFIEQRITNAVRSTEVTVSQTTFEEMERLVAQAKNDVNNLFEILAPNLSDGKTENKILQERIKEKRVNVALAVIDENRENYIAELAELAITKAIESSQKILTYEMRDEALAVAKAEIQKNVRDISAEQCSALAQKSMTSESVLQTVAKKIVVSEINRGQFPTTESVTRQLQNFVLSDFQEEITQDQRNSVAAALKDQKQITSNALSTLNNNTGGVVFHISTATRTEENLVSENRQLVTLSFYKVGASADKKSVNADKSAKVFPEVEEYVADAVKRLLQEVYVNEVAASERFDLAKKAYESCKEELSECKSTKGFSSDNDRDAEKLLAAKMRALSLDNDFAKQYKAAQDTKPDADKLKEYVAICKARVEYRKTFYDIKVKNGAWDNSPYSAQKKSDAAAIMGRYLDSMLHPEKKHTLPPGKKEEKFPDSFAAKDGKLNSIRESIQSLFGEFKDDLKFCRKADDAGKLFKALCVLRDAEKACAVNTDESKKTELELVRIKCALEYRKALYEVRQDNKTEYSGISFFRSAEKSSVTAKLKDTKAMLVQIDNLSKALQGEFNRNYVTTGVAAQDGQLGVLYQQLQAVKLIVTEKLKTPISVEQPTPKR